MPGERGLKQANWKNTKPNERTFHMKEQYMDTEKASAILQEHDYVKRDAMIDALTEEEAKVFCKFLLEGLPRKAAPKVRVRTIS